MIARVLFLLAACLATAHSSPTPAGKWSDGNAFSFTHTKSGSGTSIISTHGTQELIAGKWPGTIKPE